jgi:hypothetical protein
MSTKKRDISRHKLTEGAIKWQAVLNGVRSEISKAEQKLADLHESATFIEGKIAEGEPFPQYLDAAVTPVLQNPDQPENA